MNAKERIAELERQLAELNPNHVDLVKINGKPCEIVGKSSIGIGKHVWDKKEKAQVWVKPIPVILVKERGS